jgi:tRNA(Arg) A34 adenosine deaminase TadA
MKNIQYPYLPEGKRIEMVTMENPFMFAAYEQARKHSSDRNHPTGAVVVLNGEIIGAGANQVPLKTKLAQEIHRKWLCVRKILRIPSGQKYWLCPGCAQFKDHGEQQAVRDARKNQGNIEGADLYLWGHWWCCKPCWDAMLAAGIEHVYLLDESDVLFDRNNPNNRIGKFEE